MGGRGQGPGGRAPQAPLHSYSLSEAIKHAPYRRLIVPQEGSKAQRGQRAGRQQRRRGGCRRWLFPLRLEGDYFLLRSLFRRKQGSTRRARTGMVVVLRLPCGGRGVRPLGAAAVAHAKKVNKKKEKSASG